jgi:hypothetical protein
MIGETGGLYVVDGRVGKVSGMVLDQGLLECDVMAGNALNYDVIFRDTTPRDLSIVTRPELLLSHLTRHP